MKDLGRECSFHKHKIDCDRREDFVDELKCLVQLLWDFIDQLVAVNKFAFGRWLVLLNVVERVGEDANSV